MIEPEGAEAAGRLAQLWRLARATQTEHPALSRLLVRAVRRVACTSSAAPANAFWRAACPSCATLHVPGVTVRVRTTARSKNPRGGRRVVGMEGVLRGVGPAAQVSAVLRHECAVCCAHVVYPVCADAVAGQAVGGHGAPPSVPQQGAKTSAADAQRRAQLQRVLDRAKGTGLASFLRPK